MTAEVIEVFLVCFGFGAIVGFAIGYFVGLEKGNNL